MAKKNVSALEAHLGYWMRFVSNRVSEEFRLAVEACGVSVAEWVALRILFDSRNATHGTLTQALGMTKGAVSKIVTRLVDKGLVVREVDAADARIVSLNLSDAGRALVPHLAQLADENDRKFFAHLSGEQRAQLLEMLEETARIHQLKHLPLN